MSLLNCHVKFDNSKISATPLSYVSNHCIEMHVHSVLWLSCYLSIVKLFMCFESVPIVVDFVLGCLWYVYCCFFVSIQIRHFFVSNELHFGVYALVNIAEGEEITLPFDFKFDKWYVLAD